MKFKLNLKANFLTQSKNVYSTIINSNKYYIYIWNINVFNWGVKPNSPNKIRQEKHILINFLSMGIDFFKNLDGEYSLLIYNQTKQEIFFIRDVCSNNRLYYYHDKSFLIVSNKLNEIIQDPDFEKSLNTKKLYDDLSFSSFNDTKSFNNKETYYKNTFLLLRREFCLYKKGVIITSQYYKIPKFKLNYKNHSDYIEEFETILNQRIKLKTERFTNLGIMLSGGIDSTTIAHSLSSIFDQKTINAYSHIPYFNNKTTNNKIITNESSLINLFLKNHPNIISTYINSQNTSVLNSLFESLKLHPEPIKNANNLYWLLDIFKIAKKDNITNLIIAQKGNITISWPSKNFYNLYYKKEINNFKTFLTYILKQTQYYDNIFLKRRRRNLENHIKENTFLQKETKEKIIKRIKENSANPKNFKNKYREEMTFKELPSPFYSNPFDINFTDLTMDKKIIEYLFNIPEYFYKQSINNKFIKKYLSNKISKVIIYNKKEGIQSSDIQARVQKESNIINEYILKKNSLVNEFFLINKKNISHLSLKDIHKILFLLKF